MVTKKMREERRKEAEARQAEYNKLSITEKLAKAGAKEKRKLEAKMIKSGETYE